MFFVFLKLPIPIVYITDTNSEINIVCCVGRVEIQIEI